MALVVGYVGTAVEGSELYCYNTEGDGNSVVSQASCRMNVTRLEHCAYIKKAVLRGSNVRGAFHIVDSGLGDYFEGL